MSLIARITSMFMPRRFRQENIASQVAKVEEQSQKIKQQLDKIANDNPDSFVGLIRAMRKHQIQKQRQEGR